MRQKNGAKITVPENLLVRDEALRATPEAGASPSEERPAKGAAASVDEQRPESSVEEQEQRRESAKEEEAVCHTERTSPPITKSKIENAKAKDKEINPIQETADASCASMASRVDANAINQMLRRVLRRQPIRRHRIYELFVQHYLEREARKQTNIVSSAELLLEGRSFAERLALKMTENNLSKVVVRKTSALFDADGEWDMFVSTRDALLVAARNTAPVRFQGAVLSFMHKTVQEFLCAEGLREGARARALLPSSLITK